MDYSHITLIGRVQPRDAETRYTPSGTDVLTFRFVVNNRIKKADGYEDHAEWFQVSCFGRLAETVAKHNMAVKGARLFITGRFSTRTWIDKDGRERLSLEVAANDIFSTRTWIDKDGRERLSLEVAANDIVSLSQAERSEQSQRSESSSLGDLDEIPF